MRTARPAVARRVGGKREPRRFRPCPRAVRPVLCLLAAYLPFTAAAVPHVPYGLGASAGDGAVVLSWEQSRTTTITSWEYRYRGSESGTWITWTTIPGSDHTTYSYTVPGLTNGATYTFELRARDPSGHGRSASVTVTLSTSPDTEVKIKDTALRAAVAAALGKAAADEFTQGDLAKLSTLAATSAGIANLAGLEAAINLATLDLNDNSVADLAPLADLDQLKILKLDRNNVSDTSPLAGLRLAELRLAGNQVEDIEPLRGLTTLTTLVLATNGIGDISPLAALVQLETLNLGTNSIVAVTALRGLRALKTLYLFSNRVEDIGPLVENPGLDDDDLVDLRANPLSDEALQFQVPELRRRGVNVRVRPAAPEQLTVTPARGQATLAWKLGPVTVNYYELRHGPGDPPDFGDWERIPGSDQNTVTHTVTGLPTGGIYTFELRAVGLGGEGPAAQVATEDIAAANEPPRVVETIEDVQLEPGDFYTTDLTRHFADADDETLTYRTSSSDNRVAVASIIGKLLRVAGIKAGAATITASAVDSVGARTDIEFTVSVGIAVRVTDASAAEGSEAEVSVVLTRAREEATVLPYTIAADGDPATADADANDHEGVAGTVTIPAGATGESLMIPIVDDDEIEPAREVFVVRFRQQALDAGYVLADDSATVTIEEGVCDRTPVVRDALREGEDCTATTPADLARWQILPWRGRRIEALRGADLQGLSGLRQLDLRDNALTALPAGLLADLRALSTLRLTNNRLSTLSADALAGAGAVEYLELDRNRLSSLAPNVFAAQPGLRVLRLDDNLLTALPTGAFAGLSNLRELVLSNNPGAPFTLAMTLARADAAAAAPGPATVFAAMATAAPFAAEATVTWPDATPVALTIAAGASESDTFIVAAAGGAVQLTLAAPALPTTRCGDLRVPCFRGLATAGSTLSLFRPPPRVVGAAPSVELLGEDDFGLDAAAFFAAADGGPLTFSAMSSNPALVTAGTVDGRVVVATAAGAEEGSAEVTITATDDAGQTASLTFAVVVQPGGRGFLRGWRQGLPTEPAPPQPVESP